MRRIPRDSIGGDTRLNEHLAHLPRVEDRCATMQIAGGGAARRGLEEWRWTLDADRHRVRTPPGERTGARVPRAQDPGLHVLGPPGMGRIRHWNRPDQELRI